MFKDEGSKLTLIAALVLLTLAGSQVKAQSAAQSITATFEFTGSGTLGTQSFTNADITITASLPSSTASVSIAGLGTFQFATPLPIGANFNTGLPHLGSPLSTSAITFGGTPGGFGLGTLGALVQATILMANPTWDNIAALGAIQTTGTIRNWNSSIITTGGLLNIFDEDPTNLTFQAKLTGSSGAPMLIVSPANVTFNCIPGACNGGQSVEVAYSGDGSVSLATTPPSWLFVGQVPGQFSGPVNLVLTSVNLAPGTYTCTLHFTASNRLDGTGVLDKTVVVTLNISTPNLQTNVSQMNFQYTIGGGVPDSQTFNVTGGSVSVPFSVSTSTPWMSAFPFSGTTPTSISVGVSPFGLDVGTYHGQLTLASSGSQVTVDVVLTVTGPAVQVSPSQLTFQYAVGGTLPQQFLSVNAGPVPFTVSTSTPWITVPSGGAAPSFFAVGINPAGLAVGTYHGQLTISLSGSQVTVDVVLTVAPDVLQTDVSQLTFQYTINGFAPSQKPIVVTDSSAANIPLSISSSAPWIKATADFPTTPTGVTIGVNPVGLAVGTYHGQITISSTLTPSVTLDVTLTVSASFLMTNISQVNFQYTTGGAIPSNQTVSITSGGGADKLPVKISVSVPWLITTSAESGTTPLAVSIGVNPVGFAPGTYRGKISISTPIPPDFQGPLTNVQFSSLSLDVVLTVSAGTTPPPTPVVPPSVLQTSASQMNFQYGIGGTTPTTQTLAVTSTGAPLAVSIINVSPWIMASLSGGSTPSVVSVGFNPSALANPGTYHGQFTVLASTSHITVEVIVTVNPQSVVQTSVSQMTFQYTLGDPTPKPQPLRITSTGSTLSLLVLTSDAWITGTTSTGNTPVSTNIGINTLGLREGTYHGKVTVVGGYATSQATVDIILTVTAPSMLRTSVSQLSFQYTIGGATPASQPLQITSTGSSSLSAGLSFNAPWITTTTMTGNTPFPANIGVNPSGLKAGTYRAQIAVASGVFVSIPSQTTVDVVLTVGADTAPAITAVLNAASLKPVIGPGTWISIMGRNFSTTTTVASTAVLPDSLNGVSAN